MNKRISKLSDRKDIKGILTINRFAEIANVQIVSYIYLRSVNDTYYEILMSNEQFALGTYHKGSCLLEYVLK